MIAFDDLQYLTGIYIIIFLFYYGFFINRYRWLVKYDDPGYLECVTTTLRDVEHRDDVEIEQFLTEKIREKNRYQVYNMIFFLFFTLSFVGMTRYLASLH